MADLIVVQRADLEALCREWREDARLDWDDFYGFFAAEGVEALLATAKPADTEHEALRAENKALREAAEATGRDLGRLRDAMQESLHGIEDVRAGLEDSVPACAAKTPDGE